MQLDATDIHILQILQEDGRIANAELAQRVGLAPPTVQRRVRLLEERGYIKGYAALMDPLLLGLPITAFIFVESTTGSDLDAIAQFFTQVPGIQEVHRVIGAWCFLLKVRLPSPQALEELLNRKLRNHPGVRRTHTTLATSSPYETPALPLPITAQTDEAIEYA